MQMRTQPRVTMGSAWAVHAYPQALILGTALSHTQLLTASTFPSLTADSAQQMWMDLEGSQFYQFISSTRNFKNPCLYYQSCGTN